MNDRNLALKISKHPLLRKLMEDRTISNSIVTRLIVEELLEQEQKGSLFSALAGVNRDKKSPENFLKNYLKDGQPVYKYAKLNDLTPKQQAAYKEIVDGFIQAFSQQANPQTKQEGEKQQQAAEEKLEQQSEQEIAAIIDNAENVEQLQNINTQIQNAPDEEVSPETKQKTKKAAEQKGRELLGQQKNPYKEMPGYKELNLKPEEEIVFISFLNKLKEKNIIKENTTKLAKIIGTGRGLNDIIRELPKDNKEIIFRLLRREDVLNFIKSAVQPESTDENPYSKLEGYKELKLKPEEETVFISFLNKLKEKNIIKENSTKLAKMIGTGRGLNDIIKSFEGDNRKILYSLLNREEILAFIQKNLSNISEPQEEPGSSDPGEQLPIEQENVKQFVDSTDNFLKEFYRQKYKIKQAGFIKAVLDALGEMVEDENLAKAAQRVPDKKPKEEPQSDAAATEEKPEETEPTEEPAKDPDQEKANLQEQEEEKQASKDEMRNLRIGMNSLIKRINWSRKALDKFQATAKKGSVLAPADKKNFIKVLEEIQMSIKRICLVLQQILKDSEKLNEQEESEVIEEWKEIQKKYNLAAEAISNLAELLKPGGVSEIPKMLTNDAYSALIDLAGHFPSVAPFGQGKENRKDFQEYDVKFNNAITKVKDDLQNVFSLMKTGQAGEESLILALDGLKQFSAQIQAIFGVASQFEELKIEPNEEAAQGEPEDMSDFPRDLATQIKDLLDEYAEKYRRVKAVLARDLFKESIGDEFKRLKGALSSADKSIGAITKDYKDLIAAGEKQGISRKETASMVGDMMRYFVRVYEELMELYKKATEQPEQAKNPSWWENLWPQITAQFDKLKDMMKDLADKFGDWLVGKGLDIDITLDPDELGKAPSLFGVAKVENDLKKLLPTDKFQEITGDTKYYDVFIKTVLIMLSKRSVNEVNIGSISAPMVAASPTGLFDQKDFQEKLKELLETNQGLVREISEMTAQIPRDVLGQLMAIVEKEQSKLPALDFSQLKDSDLLKRSKSKKAKEGKNDIKTVSKLVSLLKQKAVSKKKMLFFIEQEMGANGSLNIQSSLIIWYMMIKQDTEQSLKEQEEKENRFKSIFNKIPPTFRKEMGLESGDILAVQRNLRRYASKINDNIIKAHVEMSVTNLKRVYALLGEMFKDTKILIPLNRKEIFARVEKGIMQGSQSEQPTDAGPSPEVSELKSKISGLSAFKAMKLSTEPRQDGRLSEEDLFVEFLYKFVNQKDIQEGYLVDLGKKLEDPKRLKNAIKSFVGDDRETIMNLLKRKEVQGFLVDYSNSMKTQDLVDDALLDDDDFGLTPEEQEVIRKQAEELVSQQKEKNPDANDQEIIEKAEEEIISKPEVQQMVDEETPEEDLKDAVQQKLQNAFVSHTKAIKQAKDDQFGIERFDDAYSTMNLDEESFPGFRELPEAEKQAISIFMSFMSPDFDQTALQEQEENPIGGKQAFMGYLTKFMKEDVAKQMIKKMREKEVLETFLKVLNNDTSRKRLMGYAKVFNSKIKDEPKLDPTQPGEKGPAKTVGLDALAKVIKPIVDDIKEKEPEIDDEELITKATDKVVKKRAIQKIVTKEPEKKEKIEDKVEDVVKGEESKEKTYNIDPNKAKDKRIKDNAAILSELMMNVQGEIDSLVGQARNLIDKNRKQFKKLVLEDSLVKKDTRTNARRNVQNLYVQELENVDSDEAFENAIYADILPPMDGNIEALTKVLWTATVGEMYGIKGSKQIKKAAENILKKFQNRKLEGIGIIEIPYLEKFEPRSHEGAGSQYVGNADKIDNPKYRTVIVNVTKIGLMNLSGVQRLRKARVVVTSG